MSSPADAPSGAASDASDPTGVEETIFTYGAPPLKLGAGATDELGHDLVQLGVEPGRGRVLLVTDPGVAATGAPDRIADRIRTRGIDVRLYDAVRVEPTDESLRAAVAFAQAQGPFDAFLAVGGGSAIDTAKCVDLLTTCGGDLLDYVNPPIGAGRAPDRPLRPLVAVPTTTGTGSESTPVCVLDVLALKVKTGISHPRLRPALAVVDPLLTLTLPPEVVSSSGMDILSHALESWTARPYDTFPRKQAHERVPYCGANPIADLWAHKALSLLANAFRRAVHGTHGTAGTAGADPTDRALDVQARTDMLMAATFAGMGFGSAGVHVPHANAYPIAGQVKDFRPVGYPDDEPMVPHGMSVALTAPEAFRFTFEACPERHLDAARILAPQQEWSGRDADRLPAVITTLMRDVGLPNGIGAVGYTEADVPALVEGSLKQQRLLATSPREVHAEDLERIFLRSMAHW